MPLTSTPRSWNRACCRCVSPPRKQNDSTTTLLAKQAPVTKCHSASRDGHSAGHRFDPAIATAHVANDARFAVAIIFTVRVASAEPVRVSPPVRTHSHPAHEMCAAMHAGIALCVVANTIPPETPPTLRRNLITTTTPTSSRPVGLARRQPPRLGTRPLRDPRNLPRRPHHLHRSPRFR
mmetsp:Transcript_19440/g.61130  ORF Transcript_19440/g.61130 Transcript_19440/m.61130 type:complete len:179 (-) Transcript_19440:35-571(-)